MFENDSNQAFRTFDVMLKPVGSLCNLRCEYCYYSNKQTTLKTNASIMSGELLETATREIISAHGTKATIRFNWHGGEPLLAGLPFFENALRLQCRYGTGRKIINTIQTNGTTLTDEICDFLHRHGFSVGISLDGPQALHDRYRCGSFEQAVRGLNLLKKHQVEYAVLCALNAQNGQEPEKTYDFLRTCSNYIQFLPVVETVPMPHGIEARNRFAVPPGIRSACTCGPLCEFAISAERFGHFMCSVHALWKQRDQGRIHVQIFDVIREKQANCGCSLCTLDMLCGHAPVIEADGKVYSCDRYAFGAYQLGVLGKDSLSNMLERNRSFGMYKTLGLPRECLRCPYVKICAGGCPKDRLGRTADYGKRKNVLCDGYKALFKAMGL